MAIFDVSTNFDLKVLANFLHPQNDNSALYFPNWTGLLNLSFHYKVIPSFVAFGVIHLIGI